MPPPTTQASPGAGPVPQISPGAAAVAPPSMKVPAWFESLVAVSELMALVLVTGTTTVPETPRTPSLRMRWAPGQQERLETTHWSRSGRQGQVRQRATIRS